MIKKCKECGIEFSVKHLLGGGRSAQYCSNACREKHWFKYHKKLNLSKQVFKTCRFCGIIFSSAARGAAETCSVECSKALKKKRISNYRKASPISKAAQKRNRAKNHPYHRIRCREYHHLNILYGSSNVPIQLRKRAAIIHLGKRVAASVPKIKKIERDQIIPIMQKIENGETYAAYA